MFDLLASDCKYSIRQLLKSPGVTLITILTSLLGIGISTLTTVLLDSVVFRTLPVREPSQLITYEMRDHENSIGLSGPEFDALRKDQSSCVDLMAWANDRATVDLNGHRLNTPIQLLSARSFQVLGVRPQLGVAFMGSWENNKGGGPIIAVLSDGFWSRYFNRDKGISGRVMNIAGRPVVIVGVMPKGFEGLTDGVKPDIYLPLSFYGALNNDEQALNSPGNFVLSVLGRLRTDTTLKDAVKEVNAIEPLVRRQADPDGRFMEGYFKPFHLQVFDGRAGESPAKAKMARPIQFTAILVVLFLTLCAANTTLLLLARVNGRQEEYALRSALGAGSLRIAQQILTESLLLTLPGVMCGIAIGSSAMFIVIEILAKQGLIISASHHIDMAAIIVNIIIGLSIALFASIWPIARSLRYASSLTQKRYNVYGAFRRHIKGILSVQVAVATTLVTLSALIASTLTHLLLTNPGFEATGVVIATCDLADLHLDRKSVGSVVSLLSTYIANQPGIESVGISNVQPLSGSGLFTHEFSVDNRGTVHSDAHISWRAVSPEYFQAMGTRFFSGNSMASPNDGSTFCALSKNLADYLFPSETAVGRTIYTPVRGQPDGAVLNSQHSCRVIGVVEDAQLISLQQPSLRTIYSIVKPAAFNRNNFTVVIRGRRNDLSILALKRSIDSLLPTGAKINYETLRQMELEDLSRERILAGISALFAIIALMLMGLGMYGLLEHIVASRRHEIGVRRALGAPGGAIVVAVGKGPLVEIIIGWLSGALVSSLMVDTTQRLASLPYTNTSVAYVGAIAVIVAGACIAALIPLRQALFIEPMQALRAD